MTRFGPTSPRHGSHVTRPPSTRSLARSNAEERSTEWLRSRRRPGCTTGRRCRSAPDTTSNGPGDTSREPVRKHRLSACRGRLPMVFQCLLVAWRRASRTHAPGDVERQPMRDRKRARSGMPTLKGWRPWGPSSPTRYGTSTAAPGRPPPSPRSCAPAFPNATTTWSLHDARRRLLRGLCSSSTRPSSSRSGGMYMAKRPR